MWITRKKHLCVVQEIRDEFEKLLNKRKEFTRELMTTIDKKDEVISVLTERIDNLMRENEELERRLEAKYEIKRKIRAIFQKLSMIG